MRTFAIALISSVFTAVVAVELGHRLFANAAVSLYVAVAVLTLLAILLNLQLDRRGAATAPTGGAPRERGTVKWFNRSKGFGFIIRDSGEEIFVHQRAILAREGRRRAALRDGQTVTFVVAKRSKGLQAERVAPEGEG